MSATDLRGRFTLSVPDGGALAGLGRDASYSAAERGELPTIRIGRSLRVPTYALLAQLGMPPELIAQALGLDPETVNDTSTTEVPLASVHALKSNGDHHGTPPAG